MSAHTLRKNSRANRTLAVSCKSREPDPLGKRLAERVWLARLGCFSRSGVRR